MDPMMLGLVHFVIGVFGASALVFASYLGLREIEKLPQKVYTPIYLAIYVLIGGVLAVILSSLQPTVYAPIQALAVGATWPALMQGYMLPGKFREVTSEEKEEAEDFKDKLRSLGRI